MEEDDDWVVVKKQRIIVLVPPQSPGPVDKNDWPNRPEVKPGSAQNSFSPPEKGNSNNSKEITSLTFEPLVKPLRALNLKRRAMYLERRLEEIGGLGRYLSSLRLSRFAGMMELEKLDKFQLAGLTMGKLKEMGTYEVGPRRKLLHAVDLLCQDSSG
ncbi:uncharacterized protein LOC144700793 [Wolffia australiana]